MVQEMTNGSKSESEVVQEMTSDSRSESEVIQGK